MKPDHKKRFVTKMSTNLKCYFIKTCRCYNKCDYGENAVGAQFEHLRASQKRLIIKLITILKRSLSQQDAPCVI
jgi:hypothetical protein